MSKRARTNCATSISLVVVSLLFHGCVRRTLTIRTEPDGGLVSLNGEEVGVSPVTVDFTWYGDYDVEVRKKDYATLKTNFVTPTPWYQIPPFDFFAEVLYPGHLVDSHEASFTLEPAQPVIREELVARAQELQALSRGGQPGLTEDATPTESEIAPPATDSEAAEVEAESSDPANPPANVPATPSTEVPE